MSDNNNPTTTAAGASPPDTPAPYQTHVIGDAERPNWRRARGWLRTPVASPLTLLIICAGFPITFTAVAWTLWDGPAPRPSFLTLLVHMLALAGPALAGITAVATGAVTVNLTVQRWREALRRRASMDGVMVLLARADYYHRTGVPDPITPAVHDYTAYVLDATTHTDAWRLAGMEWVVAHPGVLPFTTSVYAATIRPPAQETR